MGTDPTSRTILALASLAAALWLLWLVRAVLPPFVIGFALALLLDPLHDWLERRGWPRGAAVGLTFLLFLALFSGTLLLLVPRLVAQVADLLANLDRYSAHVQGAIDRWATEHASLLRRLRLPASSVGFWEQYRGQIGAYLQVLLSRLFESLQSLAGMLGWLVMIPIVTLYLMLDIDRLRARVRHLLPEAQRDRAELLYDRVVGVFGAYLRGLTVVCLSFGAVLWLVLEGMFRLPYALVLALAAPVLYAIPYLGQLLLVVTASLIAWSTGHSGAYIAGTAAAIVGVGQLFDQWITPRVMGRQVGLHPVVGLFALMVGGHLFGIAGMLVAVPIAAAIRVVLIELFPRIAEPIPAAGREGRAENAPPGAAPAEPPDGPPSATA